MISKEKKKKGLFSDEVPPQNFRPLRADRTLVTPLFSVPDEYAAFVILSLVYNVR